MTSYRELRRLCLQYGVSVQEALDTPYPFARGGHIKDASDNDVRKLSSIHPNGKSVALKRGIVAARIVKMYRQDEASKEPVPLNIDSLNTRQATRQYDASVTDILDAIERGALPATQEKRVWRIPRSGLDALFDRRRRRVRKGTIMNPKENSYPCPHCAKKFRNINARKLHIDDNHHTEG